MHRDQDTVVSAASNVQNSSDQAAHASASFAESPTVYSISEIQREDTVDQWLLAA